MYEKLIKCATKTGYEIQSYIPRTHVMKNRILSKNKGCLFFLLPKIHVYQLPEYYMMFARNSRIILFLTNLGGVPPSPTPMGEGGSTPTPSGFATVNVGALCGVRCG